MNTIKRAELRFNLRKETDRRAWEYLQNEKGSNNRLVITALNAFIDMQAEEARWNAHCQQVLDTIRSAVQSAPQIAVEVPSTGEQHDEEMEDEVSDFLSGFELR